MEKQGERIEKSKGAPSPGKKTAGLDLLSRSRPHSFVDLGGDAVIQSRTFEHKLKRGQIALSACYCMQFHYIFGRHGKWHGGHMENQQLRRKLVNQIRVSWLSAGAPTPEAFGMWTYTTRSTLQGKLQVGYFQKIGWRMAESCCFDMWKKDLRSWACWRLLCAGVTITHWSLKPRHVEVTWGLWCGYVWNRTGDYFFDARWLHESHFRRWWKRTRITWCTDGRVGKCVDFAWVQSQKKNWQLWSIPVLPSSLTKSNWSKRVELEALPKADGGVHEPR